MRVIAAMATRCSLLSPSATRPAAISSTSRSASRQVMSTHRSGSVWSGTW